MGTEAPDLQSRLANAPIDAFLEILPPIVRLLVRNGVLFEHAQAALVRMYLNEAVQYLESAGQPKSEVRLRILTGIGRTHVHAFLSDAMPEPELQNRIDQVYEPGRLLTAWVTDNRFLLPVIGSPRDLPIVSRPPDASFLVLAAEFAPSFEPGALLDELVRLGNVVLNDERTTVRFVKREYLPAGDSPAQILRMANGAKNLIETLEHNRAANPGQQRFERGAQADFPISPSDARAFDDLVRTEGQRLLELLDQWLSEREPDYLTGARSGANLFHYVEPMTGGALAPPSAAAAKSERDRAENGSPKEIDLLEGFLSARDQAKDES
jgi:Family of unknown function (DUF6502)